MKVVPTTYEHSDGSIVDTNRFGATSKFKPLITVEELDPRASLDELHSADTLHHTHKASSEEEHKENNDNKDLKNEKDDHIEHRTKKVQHSVLPGVFWVYEIHPFTVSVKAGRDATPFSHLLLRLIAVIGGVLTVGGWLDKLLLLREKSGKGGNSFNSGGAEISTDGLIGLRR